MASRIALRAILFGDSLPRATRPSVARCCLAPAPCYPLRQDALRHPTLMFSISSAWQAPPCSAKAMSKENVPDRSFSDKGRTDFTTAPRGWRSISRSSFRSLQKISMCDRGAHSSSARDSLISSHLVPPPLSIVGKIIVCGALSGYAGRISRFSERPYFR